MKTEKRLIGDIGEQFCCDHLVRKGYRIIDRNFLCRCGELDIVAKISHVIHFVEVKTVTRRYICNTLSQEGNSKGDYRAEDNMHTYKTLRLKRAIEIYLDRHKGIEEWQFDLCVIVLDSHKNLIKLDYYDDLII